MGQLVDTQALHALVCNVRSSVRLPPVQHAEHLGNGEGIPGARDSGRITNDLFSYNGVSVSADGTQLVSVQTDGRSSIWTGSLAEPDRLSRTVDGVGAIYGTDALPSGGFVYAARASGNIDIWSSRGDGSARTRLTDDPAVDSNPVVSPSGDRIAFTST